MRLHADANFIEAALTPTPSVFENATIGSLRPDNFNEPWVGWIDDVRIFDQVLTIEEVNAIRAPIMGVDFNEDGVTDLADFDILTSNFNTANATFAEGDADFNFRVDLVGFLIFREEFAAANVAAASVPEPASYFLLRFGLLVTLGLARLRQRRSSCGQGVVSKL